MELGRLMFDRGVTFRELSRRTGIAPATLNQYVNGRRRPRDETIVRVARGLAVAPEQFFEWRRRRVLERLGEREDAVELLWRRMPAG